MSDNTLNVIVVCGGLRTGSYNAALARTLPALAPPGMALNAAPGWDTMPVYNHDLHADGKFPAEVTAWGDAIRAADGVILNSPEYNFGIPAPLKNAIDWVSRVPSQPFAGKPVALQSVSPGPVGGARMQYDLRKSMMFLDAFTLNKPEIFIGNCAARIDEKTGEIKDEATRGFIKQQLAAFATFIARVAPKS